MTQLQSEINKKNLIVKIQRVKKVVI